MYQNEFLRGPMIGNRIGVTSEIVHKLAGDHRHTIVFYGSCRATLTSTSLNTLVRLVSIVMALMFSPIGFAAPPIVTSTGEDCGSVERRPGQTGPWDYLNPSERTSDKVSLVENAHFTPEVERLISGNRGHLAGDISYTLRVWPNHHRALMSMVNLAIREKTTKPNHSRYSLACYFERARRMNSADGMVDLIQAIYESKRGNWANALPYAQQALERLPEDRNVHYNLGLIYFNLNDLANARIHAKKAYSMGYPLPGLKRMLTSANAWED